VAPGAAAHRSVVNRTIFTLRRDVEAKLNRLPLPYFDGQPRGELLSRVTNDIDNVAQSLQQTLSQLLTSLLTVVAMLGMMFWISPLLALIALVTIPVDGRHGDDRQAQPEALRAAVEEHRRGQRHRRGVLHRARARQGLRPPGRGRPRLRRANDALHHASFGRSSSAASSCRR
jgi:ABC-type multidrug transport system fused ATPase/permease subunit